MKATLRDTRTPDVGGTATTREFTAGVVRNLSWLRWDSSAGDDMASSEWAV